MEEHIVFHELCCKALEKFGKNPHGQFNYRVVRADTRIQFIAGEFCPKYPKYGGTWILEVWCAPEKYGDQVSWEAAKDHNGRSSLGPYPRQGDYEMSYAFLNDKEAYMPGEELAQVTAEMVERTKNVTRSQRWSQIQEEKDKAKERRMKILRDMIADAAPLRGGIAVGKHADKLVEKTPVARPAMPVGPSLG